MPKPLASTIVTFLQLFYAPGRTAEVTAAWISSHLIHLRPASPQEPAGQRVNLNETRSLAPGHRLFLDP